MMKHKLFSVYLYVALTSLGSGLFGDSEVFIDGKASDPPQNGEAFLIVNANSGRCLAEKDGSIVQSRIAPPATLHEYWRLVKHDDYYEIVNAKSGKRLTLPDGSRSVGTNLTASSPYDGEGLNQQWHFDKVGSDYAIRSPVSGLVVAVADESKTDGSRVIQWTWHKGKEQIWILKKSSGSQELIELQGKWEMRFEENGRPIRVINIVKDDIQIVETYDSETLVRSHVVKIELIETGRLVVLRWGESETTDGPNKGTKGKPGSCVSKRLGTKWYQVVGVGVDEPHPPSVHEFTRIE